MANYLEALKRRLKQPSTVRGLALIGSGVALASGQGNLFTATVTDAGVSYGGFVGAAIPFAVGFWETVRDQFKGA
ncbi:hypothetical protein [Grimontia sp. NTOU-MAR1]|uniref:hypothetical protein n=1 Tax=Grimontia sp. NTOU-MAR1 TaxID=3111011 RepID=UPI002DBE1175|nr:hypothetical protein [Grimontia sp. NTOU-MAR1]WRV98255.1 hypothetical protein VP504_02120 [Grimontia sp. NTOU-MAR1]